MKQLEDIRESLSQGFQTLGMLKKSMQNDLHFLLLFTASVRESTHGKNNNE
ncbi:hypothetical protein MOC70_03150 [Bacillus vallismortis]|uniref:hypothetical protein n=1 Tax=Bacillus vallismortis TaxID=72361 RepID=UPI0022831B18|nr:hypothetical protein [Bacillus vallismortis]MCY8423641.1 hypothetical protein [Bacillus vallismortis]